MPTVIRNLCCKPHVAMALSAFRAIQALAADEIELIIHEDGSFSDSDADLISRLPMTRVIRRRESDALMMERLARYPMLLRARSEFPYFQKLSDILLIDPAPVTCFLDSDVLFLRPFKYLTDLSRHGGKAVFMTDVRNAYGFRPQDFWPIGNLRLAARLNSGLFAVATADVDLDYIESILKTIGIDQVRIHQGWLEQGIWSAIGFGLRANLFDSGQIALVERPEELRKGPIAMHFTGRSRQRFHEFANREPEEDEIQFRGQFEEIRSSPASEYTLAGKLWHSIAGRASRLVGGKA